jgi:hypothetical protein
MSLKYLRVRFHVVSATPSMLIHELLERNLDLIVLMVIDPI